MVNIPYRSSESLIAAHVSEHDAPLRRTAGAIVLGFIAAMIVGALLAQLPEGFGGEGLRNLIPLDDPIALSTFTA